MSAMHRAARPGLDPGFAIVAIALVALAFVNRLTVDDAYIYYRYARNLIEGLGWVWNPGEPVEGFTSVPWVLWVAACLRIGIDPSLTGLLFFGVTLWLIHAAARDVSGSRAFALVVLFAYGTNFTVSSFATGGLETSLHLATLAACLWLFLRLGAAAPEHAHGILLGLSVMLGVAFFVRMDSAVFIAPLLGAAALRVGKDARALAALTVPAAGIALAFVVFRLVVFGDLFPNTFYVKATGGHELGRGLDHAVLFHHDYLLHLVLIPVIVAVWQSWRGGSLDRRAGLTLAALAAAWLSWCGYVTWIGGGFMEFRMVLAALPPLLLLVAAAWRRADAARAYIGTALAVACLVNLTVHVKMWRANESPFTLVRQHNRFPYYLIPRGAESVPLLRAHLHHEQDDWIAVGRRLGEVFGHDPEILIATTAAGAVPYFSRLRTLDMLGLNDRWIARAGRALTSRPGHSKGATAAYMVERGVHLVVAHPVMVPRERLPDALASLPSRLFWFDAPPPGARLVAVPVNERYAIVLLYLKRHATIDAAIATRNLPTLAPAARRPA